MTEQTDIVGRPPHLDHDQLVAAEAETLAAPRRRYGLLARMLFFTLDLLYGKKRTLSKFKVLELVARVPYQAWEQVAYIAMTHRYSRPTTSPGGSSTGSGRARDSRTTSSGTC